MRQGFLEVPLKSYLVEVGERVPGREQTLQRPGREECSVATMSCKGPGLGGKGESRQDEARELGRSRIVQGLIGYMSLAFRVRTMDSQCRV